MEYVVYIDVLFLTDFFLTTLSLILTAILLKKHIVFQKLLAAGILGSVWNCLLVVTPFLPRWLELPVTAAGVGSLMGVILFGRKQIIRNAAALWISSALLGGCMGFFRRECYLTDWESLALIGIVTAVIGISLREIVKTSNRSRERYAVDLYFKGKKREFTGLVDSGNRLRVPQTGKCVSVVSYRDCTGFCDCVSGGFFIPYRAVGTEHGLLFAITFEKMEIRYNGMCITIDHPVVAIAKEPLSECGDFNMILPEEYISM